MATPSFVDHAVPVLQNTEDIDEFRARRPARGSGPS